MRAQLAKEETVYSDRDLCEILGDLAEAYGMVDEFTRQTELLEELLMINKEIDEKAALSRITTELRESTVSWDTPLARRAI